MRKRTAADNRDLRHGNRYHQTKEDSNQSQMHLQRLPVIQLLRAEAGAGDASRRLLPRAAEPGNETALADERLGTTALLCMQRLCDTGG